MEAPSKYLLGGSFRAGLAGVDITPPTSMIAPRFDACRTVGNGNFHLVRYKLRSAGWLRHIGKAIH